MLRNDPTNVAVQVNLALSLAMAGDSAAALRLIEPLARDPGASAKIRDNYGAILAMAGRESDAAAILKQDLSESDVRQALASYRQGRTAVAIATASAPAVSAIADVTPPAPPIVRKIQRADALPVPPRFVVPPSAQTPVVVAAASPPMPEVVRPSEQTQTVTITDTAAPLPAASADAPGQVVPVPTQAAAAPPAAPQATVAAVVPVQPPVQTAPPRRAEARHGVNVQLGAFASERAAHAEWRRLKKQMPLLIAEHDPVYIRVTRDSDVFWRLRTWGFADRDYAHGFCSQLRPATDRCLVLRG